MTLPTTSKHRYMLEFEYDGPRLEVSARHVAADGRGTPITGAGDSTNTISLEALTRMVIKDMLRDLGRRRRDDASR